MTDTKIVEIRGKPYTIKRFTFGEGEEVDGYIDGHKDKVKDQQVFIVVKGTVEPKLTEELVKEEDRETIVQLWYEIQSYNKFDTAFLSLLKNSSSQDAPPAVTRPS